MRSKEMRFAFAVILLALAVGANAQNSSSPVVHHHYTLIDMGTFGGPQTYPNIVQSVQTLSQTGVLSGCSETAMANPKYPNGNPFLYPPPEPDPYIVHAFEYRNGVVADLGALPGANSSCAFWTSDDGQTTGASENGQIDPLTGWPEIEAVVWRNGHLLPLGTLGGYESFPVSINNRGQVTGIATNAVPDDLFGFGTQVRAFLLNNGRMRDIGTLGGPDAFGIIVNDRGQVLGFSLTADLGGDAFLWQNGAFTDIPDMIGGTEINPFFMNNQAMVIGNASVVDDQVFHPFFWRNGVMQDIGTFGGTDGEAVWVNQKGQVVGTANFAGDTIHHAFLWQNGTLTDLPPTPPYDWSGASAINSLGQAVGFAADSQSHQALAPMLWERGEAIDVSTLTNVPPNMYIAGAININDRGEISAVGVVDNAYLHALLLVPHGICDGNCQSRIAASKPGKANAAAKSAAGFSDPYADGSRRHSAIARLLRNRGR